MVTLIDKLMRTSYLKKEEYVVIQEIYKIMQTSSETNNKQKEYVGAIPNSLNLGMIPKYYAATK